MSDEPLKLKTLATTPLALLDDEETLLSFFTLRDKQQVAPVLTVHAGKRAVVLPPLDLGRNEAGGQYGTLGAYLRYMIHYQKLPAQHPWPTVALREEATDDAQPRGAITRRDLTVTLHLDANPFYRKASFHIIPLVPEEGEEITSLFVIENVDPSEHQRPKLKFFLENPNYEPEYTVTSLDGGRQLLPIATPPLEAAMHLYQSKVSQDWKALVKGGTFLAAIRGFKESKLNKLPTPLRYFSYMVSYITGIGIDQGDLAAAFKARSEMAAEKSMWGGQTTYRGGGNAMAGGDEEDKLTSVSSAGGNAADDRGKHTAVMVVLLEELKKYEPGWLSRQERGQVHSLVQLVQAREGEKAMRALQLLLGSTRMTQEQMRDPHLKFMMPLSMWCVSLKPMLRAALSMFSATTSEQEAVVARGGEELEKTANGLLSKFE